MAVIWMYGTHEIPMQHAGEDISVQHPRVTLEKSGEGVLGSCTCFEPCTTCFNLQVEIVIRASQQIIVDLRDESNISLLVFSIIPVVKETPMLSKATVRPDAICRCTLLYNHLLMHSVKCICDKGCVPGKEALIQANVGDIKCIRASQEPEAVNVHIEGAKSSKSYAAASCNLGR
jgi:hypothetical protein